MGGFATLHFGFRHAQMARSLVVAGCGYGAEPGREQRFRLECEATAGALQRDMAGAALKYALGPMRVQFQNKDPRGWDSFARRPCVGRCKRRATPLCHSAEVAYN